MPCFENRKPHTIGGWVEQLKLQHNSAPGTVKCGVTLRTGGSVGWQVSYPRLILAGALYLLGRFYSDC